METIGEKYEKEAKEMEERIAALKKEKNQLLRLFRLMPSMQRSKTKKYEGVANELVQKEERLSRWRKSIKDAKEDHEEILDGFWCSVFYLSGENVYELSITGRKDREQQKQVKNENEKKEAPSHLLSLKEFQKDPKEGSISYVLNKAESEKEAKLKEVLDTFFYTVAINYSHYALNSNSIGLWIQALFHKNDGYQSPLVISPMRDEGNFDINDEAFFAQQRLLSNIIIQYKNGKRKIKLTDKQYVSRIRYSIKRERIETNKKDNSWVLINIVGAFYGGLTSKKLLPIIESGFPFKYELRRYVLNKIKKVRSIYKPYNTKNEGKDSGALFFRDLGRDHSHITIKLRQVANFVYQMCTNSHLKQKWEDFYTERISRRTEEVGNVFDMDLEDMRDWVGSIDPDWMDSKNLSFYYMLILLPPPIFDLNILLRDEAGNEMPYITLLSSGEQQMIHSVQSVTYHLNNLESVFNIDKSIEETSVFDRGGITEYWGTPNVPYSNNLHKGSLIVKKLTIQDDTFLNRWSYKNVNIILDEIELYFHPAMQQRYVYELLKGIKRLSLKNIKYINILFSTHSPFILSDLPKSNILYLKADKEGENTEKVKQRLMEAKGQHTFGANIHDLLSHSFYMNEGFMGDVAKEKITSLIEFLTDKRHEEYWDDKKARTFIGQIGEPMLKDSLQDLADKKYISYWEKTNSELQEEINLMNEIINKRGPKK